MFVTLNNQPIWVLDASGQALIDSGEATRCSAVEAAGCVSRAAYLGDRRMHAMKEEFERDYHINRRSA